eukprot:93675-Amorphochlora_amoeboformis.AAC.1
MAEKHGSDAFEMQKLDGNEPVNSSEISELEHNRHISDSVRSPNVASEASTDSARPFMWQNRRTDMLAPLNERAGGVSAVTPAGSDRRTSTEHLNQSTPPVRKSKTREARLSPAPDASPQPDRKKADKKADKKPMGDLIEVVGPPDEETHRRAKEERTDSTNSRLFTRAGSTGTDTLDSTVVKTAVSEVIDTKIDINEPVEPSIFELGKSEARVWENDGMVSIKAKAGRNFGGLNTMFEFETNEIEK